MKWLAVSLLLAGILLLGNSQSAVYECYNCTDCNTAIAGAAAGDTILLAQNITNVSGDCINISYKDNLAFDCNSYPITGMGNGAGINLSFSNHSILLNCIMQNFSYGIWVGYSVNSSVINITTKLNWNEGVSVRESDYSWIDTIHSEDPFGNTGGNYSYFFNISVQNVSRSWGSVSFANMNSSLVKNVSVYDGILGINMEESAKNILSGLALINNDYGIRFEYYSKNNTVNDSLIEGNECGAYLSDIWNTNSDNNFFYNNI